MSSSTTMDEKLMEVMSFISVQKEAENDYLCSLKEMLDVYLLSVMEEEDSLYALLYQRDQYASNSYERLKTVSIDCFQLNLVFALPLLPNHIEVLYTGETPGFVEMKLPSLLDEHVQYSKIWRESCYKGVQKSLLRHLKLWKDDDNYLLQAAFNEWFSGVVDKGLQLAEGIPNFELRRLTTSRGEVVLEIKDCQQMRTSTVTLLPVIGFPTAQLPEPILQVVPSSIECEEWMVECRPHPSLSARLWGVSLWQHERKILKDNVLLKNTIRLIKGIRDGCQLKHLKNYHIKSLVILEHQENPAMFGECCPSTLLINVLLKLRDRIVSPNGIPFIWDKSYNVLCGLTGHDRADLARAVTNVRLALLRCERDHSLDIMDHFRKPTVNDPSESEIQRRHSAASTVSTSSESYSDPPQYVNPNRIRPSGDVSNSRPHLPEAREPSSPRYQFVPERGAGSRAQLVAEEQSSNGWLWAAGAAAAAVGILGTVLAQRSKKNH